MCVPIEKLSISLGVGFCEKPIPPQQGLEDEGCGYGLDVFGIHQDRAQPEVLSQRGVSHGKKWES